MRLFGYSGHPPTYLNIPLDILSQRLIVSAKTP